MTGKLHHIGDHRHSQGLRQPVGSLHAFAVDGLFSHENDVRLAVSRDGLLQRLAGRAAVQELGSGFDENPALGAQGQGGTHGGDSGFLADGDDDHLAGTGLFQLLHGLLPTPYSSYGLRMNLHVSANPAPSTTVILAAVSGTCFTHT